MVHAFESWHPSPPEEKKINDITPGKLEQAAEDVRRLRRKKVYGQNTPLDEGLVIVDRRANERQSTRDRNDEIARDARKKNTTEDILKEEGLVTGTNPDIHILEYEYRPIGEEKVLIELLKLTEKYLEKRRSRKEAKTLINFVLGIEPTEVEALLSKEEKESDHAHSLRIQLLETTRELLIGAEKFLTEEEEHHLKLLSAICAKTSARRINEFVSQRTVQKKPMPAPRHTIPARPQALQKQPKQELDDPLLQNMPVTPLSEERLVIPVGTPQEVDKVHPAGFAQSAPERTMELSLPTMNVQPKQPSSKEVTGPVKPEKRSSAADLPPIPPAVRAISRELDAIAEQIVATKPFSTEHTRLVREREKIRERLFSFFPPQREETEVQPKLRPQDEIGELPRRDTTLDLRHDTELDRELDTGLEDTLFPPEEGTEKTVIRDRSNEIKNGMTPFDFQPESRETTSISQRTKQDRTPTVAHFYKDLNSERVQNPEREAMEALRVEAPELATMLRVLPLLETERDTILNDKRLQQLFSESRAQALEQGREPRRQSIAIKEVLEERIRGLEITTGVTTHNRGFIKNIKRFFTGEKTKEEAQLALYKKILRAIP